MRVGQRLTFRGLRCTGRFVEYAKLKDGSEITRWHYRFAGVDGRTYLYRGNHLYKIEPGCYWDCLATVSFMRGFEVTIKRPKTLEPEQTPQLI